jgi:hypothetical protein
MSYEGDRSHEAFRGLTASTMSYATSGATMGYTDNQKMAAGDKFFKPIKG